MEKVQEKVDFIVGREIEIGGIYKGVISSVKEYGAFVEFNGGQQGLLHISELSHEPVSRVVDVVSVGQQISLMCIGQDVRGNIKLSLKATLPQPGSVTNGVTEGSLPLIKEVPTNVWASVADASSRQEKQGSTLEELLTGKNEIGTVNSSASSLPSILIRSAAECDEEEKSAGLTQSSRAANVKKSKPPSNTHNQVDLNKKKEAVAAPVTEKILKLGNKVTATVYQIRARGLVLDLGGGIRGMYRFETNGKRDFEVGDELHVECSSFTSRGIPVMSLVDD